MRRVNPPTPWPWRWAERALGVSALLVAAYALLAYALWPAGATVSPAMREVYRVHPFLIHAHAFGAGLALALGPWQFSARLRATRPRLHRWAGRLYLLAGVGVGGVSGLGLAFLAQGGVPARLGFAGLALAWLYTGLRGLQAIRAGQPARHRQWMLRNHALTLAAVSLRLYLGLALALGWPFELAYPVIAWLCWVPQLALAQWWLRRREAAG